MNRLALGYGLGFFSGVVAVPATMIYFADHAATIGHNLSKIAEVFENFASGGEAEPIEEEPVEEASSSAVTGLPTELSNEKASTEKSPTE